MKDSATQRYLKNCSSPGAQPGEFPEFHCADAPTREPERYEFAERRPHYFQVDRRDFFKLLGAGMVVCAAAQAPLVAQESGRAARAGSGGEDTPRKIAAWIHISETGAATVYTGKAEMGQNIRTSLAQQVAEELRVPLGAVSLVMADTALTPFDAGTFGSRTTPQMGTQLRKVAAAARQALIDLAAERLNQPKEKLVARAGTVTTAGGADDDGHGTRSVTYAELLKGQQIQKDVGDNPPLTPAANWSVGDAPAPKANGRDFVTGAHQYTSDIRRPGMLYGKVVRPSAFNAALKSVDAAAAQAMPGVSFVHDGNFVAVAAPSEHAALAAARAVQAASIWDAPQQIAEAQLYDYLRQPSPGSNGEIAYGAGRHVEGDVQKAQAAADKKLSASYTVAYIAHTPLEPRAAVAEWTGDQLTVWTGTQRPFAVRDELADAFHVASDRVRVIVPDTGSAYGGKHTGECAVEAARLAKAAGKPVKLVWSREEEFTWAYFRPAGVIDVRCAATRDGKLTAWEFDNYNSGAAAIRTYYDAPNQRIEFHATQSPLRQGSYRGLAATANHFARESAMDEMAHDLALDPLAFRLKNLSEPRLKAIFEAVADKFGWDKVKAASGSGYGGVGYGIAGGFEKGGYLATAAETSVEKDGTVRIRRVVTGFDCGAIVNPDGLRNQVAGALVQAIGGALFEAIHFENGKILNPHLAEYRVPRFSDAPRIDVVLIDRKDKPSFGAGETPIVGLAPAVANGIFQATGVRLRALPLAPQGVRKS